MSATVTVDRRLIDHAQALSRQQQAKLTRLTKALQKERIKSAVYFNRLTNERVWMFNLLDEMINQNDNRELSAWMILAAAKIQTAISADDRHTMLASVLAGRDNWASNWLEAFQFAVANGLLPPDWEESSPELGIHS